MFDLDVSKIALIGAVALVVIGPEKLPKVARTVGTLIGKAQRYVSDVKAEVNRAMEMEDLKKMRESFESAAKEVQTSVDSTTRDMQNEWSSLSNTVAGASEDPHLGASPLPELSIPSPIYRNPNKKWRIKQSAMPQWYKAQRGIRTKALSGSARVARFRPQARPSSLAAPNTSNTQ